MKALYNILGVVLGISLMGSCALTSSDSSSGTSSSSSATEASLCSFNLASASWSIDPGTSTTSSTTSLSKSLKKKDTTSTTTTTYPYITWDMWTDISDLPTIHNIEAGTYARSNVFHKYFSDSDVVTLNSSGSYTITKTFNGTDFFCDSNGVLLSYLLGYSECTVNGVDCLSLYVKGCYVRGTIHFEDGSTAESMTNVGQYTGHYDIGNIAVSSTFWSTINADTTNAYVEAFATLDWSTFDPGNYKSTYDSFCSDSASISFNFTFSAEATTTSSTDTTTSS